MAQPNDPSLNSIGNQQYNEMQNKQLQNEKKQQDMNEQKRLMMASILTADARERLSRVKLVKPQRAELVENHLIRSAQSGQLRGKVDENSLIQLLSQVSTQETKPKVTYKRRKLYDSDEEEEEESDTEEDEEY